MDCLFFEICRRCCRHILKTSQTYVTNFADILIKVVSKFETIISKFETMISNFEFMISNFEICFINTPKQFYKYFYVVL